MTLRFGPTTNLAVQDTSQIGQNAATDIYSASLAGPSTTGTQVGIFAVTVAVPVVNYNHTAIVTLTCDGWRSVGGGIWVERDTHGSTTGGVASEERFLIQSASPGERVTIQYEFSNLAGTAYDYNLQFDTLSPSNTITVQNVRMQVEIIKRLVFEHYSVYDSPTAVSSGSSSGFRTWRPMSTSGTHWRGSPPAAP